VTLTAASTVAASFASAPAVYTLTVTASGEGTVVSTPTGITCGADCIEGYAAGSVITLSALPKTGWTFAGWTGGGCSGTAPCTVTLAAARTVAASFVKVRGKR
jgi:uncharacterized repeat protein (TIGR02543 family)